MTTLREKIDALAAPCTCHDDYKRRGREDPSCRHHDEQDAALAAARLALEYAAGVCDDKSLLYDGMEDSASTRYFADKMRGSRDAADQCAAAIRDRAKTLGADA